MLNAVLRPGFWTKTVEQTVLVADHQAAVADRRRGLERFARREMPEPPAVVEIHRVQVAVVAAHIDPRPHDNRRRVDVATGGELPQLLAVRQAEAPQQVVAAANNNPLADHRRRGVEAYAGLLGLELPRGLPCGQVQAVRYYG